MKYRMLSKEQFEELHEEFALFLASQEIDSTEWTDIKKNRPKVAEQEMQIFSDVVWDRVLGSANYLDHLSPKSLNLFKVEGTNFHRILIKIDRDINLNVEEDYKWLFDNLSHESVSIFKATKEFGEDYKQEIFDLIQKGAELSKGLVFEAISERL